MALFPTSPSNGDQTTVNGITYVYASATQSWTRVPSYAWALGNGTSSLTFGTSGGNANISIGGTSNVLVVANTSTNFAGNLLPTSNVTYSLGSTTNRWKDLWISNSTIYLGETTLTTTGNTLTVSGDPVVTTSGGAMSVSGNITGANLSVTGNAVVGNVLASGYYWANGVAFGGGGGGTPGGSNTYIQFNDNGAFNGTAGFTFNKASNAIVAAGNITAGNLIQGGNRVALWTTSNTTPSNSIQGDQWYVPSSDKRYLYVNDGTSNTWVDQSQTTSFSTLAVTGNTTIGANLGVTGNITSGNLTVGTGTITFGTATNAGANGTGNIGSSTGYFNTVFAKATSAQYADLAEKYSSDQQYEPGTVVVFGGEQEVTLAINANDTAIAGVVSTNPAYIMNAGIQSEYSVEVALTGRVPTKVLGPVRKGNMMVSAGNGYAQACATPSIGTVIGKAIENFNGAQGVIEIVVGRM